MGKPKSNQKSNSSKSSSEQVTEKVTKQSLGLDVSKDSVYACFSQQEPTKPFRVLSSKSFNITASGFQKLDAWIVSQQAKDVPLHVLMEATGVYYENLAYFLQGRNYRVCVLLPNKTHAYAKSLDYKSKNDKIDARMLSQMSLERELPRWAPPSDKMLEIKRLCRERNEIIAESVAFSNRLHAKKYSHDPLKSSLKRAQTALKLFDKQVKEVDKLIKEAVYADPDIKQKIDNVCTIPGVGLTSAAAIVSEANGFNLFKNKAQLISYVGYDVVENQSGTSVDRKKKISKKGNSHIRKALHFPALVAIKYNPEMANLYARVFGETKIKMKAYVAIQRKLLVLIYTLYKNNVPFELNFEAQKGLKKIGVSNVVLPSVNQ
jgi:transposase